MKTSIVARVIKKIEAPKRELEILDRQMRRMHDETLSTIRKQKGKKDEQDQRLSHDSI